MLLCTAFVRHMALFCFFFLRAECSIQYAHSVLIRFRISLLAKKEKAKR